MGRRGPKPAPTVIRKMRGDRKDRIPANEPQPPPGAPTPPIELSPTALAEWQRITPILDRSRVLTEADGAALAIYCETFAEWIDATRRVRRQGMLLPTAAGGLKVNPLAAVAAKARTDAARLLTEFGLTPSSRSRVTTLPDAAADPMAEFLPPS